MEKPVVIFGSGSQGRYCVDNLAACRIAVAGLVDLEAGAMVGTEVNGVPVRWDRRTARSSLTPAEALVIVAHGDNGMKLELAAELEELGFGFATAVHPAALVSPWARIGAGCIVNAGAMILPNAVLEPHAIVHSGAIIEHDCVIGRGANVAPGAKLAGRVTVGRQAYVYTGAVIIPKIRVGDRAIVGAGAVVLRDVPEDACVVGNPARQLR